MNKDLTMGAVTHYTYVASNGKLTLTNGDDDFYRQQFDLPEEFFAMIEYLIEQGNSHYDTNYRLVSGEGTKVDGIESIHYRERIHLW